jgi:potassium efflux system protein
MIFSLSVIVAITVFWSEHIPVFSVLEQFEIPLTNLTLLALGKAILIVVVTWIAVQNLPGLLELSVLRTMSIDTGTRYAIARVSQYIVTAIGLALLFGVLNVDWSKFGWIAAALSVGLGFGLQEVVANFVCGLILLFEQPVRVGDVVTLNNMTGTVTKIQMRATTITNWDRQEIIVPNKNLITGTILNWTLSAAVNRVVIPVGVAYGTDTERARQILLEVATDHPLVLGDPGPSTSFEQFADSSLTIILRAYLPNLDNRLKTISELHTEIDKRFASEDIQIAFPQLDLHLRDSGEQSQLRENVSPKNVRESY